MRRQLVLKLSFVICLSVVGCGGPTGPVRKYADVVGKVSYKGVPLKMGTVMFQPASGPFASGTIQPDGTYRLKGEIGQNSVQITSRDPEDTAPPDPAKLTTLVRPKSHIPEKYGEPASGLQFVVKEKDNQADFDLK